MIMAVAANLQEKEKTALQDNDDAITNICPSRKIKQVRAAIHEAASA
jgi:hypothetical protein